jgi:hypothetical protein
MPSMMSTVYGRELSSKASARAAETRGEIVLVPIRATSTSLYFLALPVAREPKIMTRYGWSVAYVFSISSTVFRSDMDRLIISKLYHVVGMASFLANALAYCKLLTNSLDTIWAAILYCARAVCISLNCPLASNMLSSRLIGILAVIVFMCSPWVTSLIASAP